MFRQSVASIRTAIIRTAIGLRSKRRRRSGTTSVPAVEFLENRALLAAAFPEFVDPNPSEGNGFGREIVPLSTGNVVITSPFDDAGGVDAGAVYLFNGSTGELISTLTGSQDGDRVGGQRSSRPAVTTLANGNFIVASPFWNNGGIAGAGAVTFGSGISGVGGNVSPENSLVGTVENEQVGGIINENGEPGVVALPDGNYVVTSVRFQNGLIQDAGAVIQGDGINGTTGIMTPENSLVGTSAGDFVGLSGITVLANGNYVVSSGGWNSPDAERAGAITFVDVQAPVTGGVSQSNSLVGGSPFVFLAKVTPLTNGNFVVSQPEWKSATNDAVGAVQLVDGTTGTTGVIDASSSLVGANAGDRVGTRVVPLTNGNYIVVSWNWDNGSIRNAGAVTLQSGTVATGAVVSESNSLIGTGENSFIILLANGNAVAVSRVPNQNRSGIASATTFIDGTTGLSGPVSVQNSLIFAPETINTTGFAEVSALPNGNYLVNNVNFGEDGRRGRGALTLGDGQSGISGIVSDQNSLVGTIGVEPPVVLPNSNYLISLSNSGSNRYFGSGTSAPTGQYSDEDGLKVTGSYALTNGNLVLEGQINSVGASVLIDADTGPTGERDEVSRLPIEGAIPARGGVPVGNGNYTIKHGLDLIVGDGQNNGVFASTTPGVFRTDDGVFLFPVSDSGNFIAIDVGFDLGDQQDVGAIVFVDGSPNFNTQSVESNLWIGNSPGFEFEKLILDEVNEQFYVHYEVGGVSKVLTGSTIDGFATEGTGPAVDLSVSSNTATENDQPQITVTATANSAVSGDQTVLLIPSGNGITSNDFAFSSQTITIPDGQTSGSVTLTINSDGEVEGTEFLVLTLVSPSSGIQLGDTTQQTITIIDSLVPLVLDAVPRFPTDTTPTFTWNDAGANRYEVWLGQTSPVSSRLQIGSRFVTSTSYTSSEELSAGTYRVWVRVNDTRGNIGSWSAGVPFEFRPTLLAPLSAVSTLRPTFTWEAIPGASAYQIWIGTRTGRIIESDLVGTSWTPSQDLPAGDIRWWIRAMESTHGGWSDVGLASVGGVTGGGPTSVLTPTGTTADTTPVFSWQAIDGSSRYILHVQNLITGSVVIREDNLTSTSFTPATALTSGNYRVWVKAIGASGNFNDGTWSAPVDFTIAAVSEERPSDIFAMGWTSLDDLLKTDDTAQSSQAAVTADSSARDIAKHVTETNSQRDLPNPTDETGLSPVAAADSPELRLSLLWQQPQLQEWLLFKERS